MERRSPDERGYRAGEPRAARGRARRFACAAEELWRFDEADVEVADRLLELGRQGVGGFVDGGVDDDGPWLVRALPAATLAELRRSEREGWPGRRALAVLGGAARALRACEAACLSPGALVPDAVHVAFANDDDGTAQVCLAAEALVGALVGEPPGARGTLSADPRLLRWAPPEKLDDAVWDAGSNRYALGVLAYELLTGKHPFAGAGLRHALREAGEVEAAPFPAEVARGLPPGFQALVLKMIAPDVSRRPSSAATIADELAAIASQKSPVSSLQSPGARAAAARPRGDNETVWMDDALREEAPRRGRAKLKTGDWRLKTALRWVPLVVGIVVLGLAAAFALEKPPEPERTGPRVGREQPVDAAHTRATDCASCHPRHAAEWSQSVMGHAVKSPLFNALESLIEEQVGRDRDCPGGAGILRRADPTDACIDRQSGLRVTGSGGEHWCVNCHAPGENLASAMPAWRGRDLGDARSRRPVSDLIGNLALEGISCAFCHQVHGPVGPNGSGGYQGNPVWTSFVTGSVFRARPEDARGLFGIANSGYALDQRELILAASRALGDQRIADDAAGFAVHARPTNEARAHLRSSEFCGTCHDVRLFGTDVLGARDRGEHFKRLRNAYSEWVAYSDDERRAGRQPATCQGCHMSTFPGVCVDGDPRDQDLAHRACPKGMHFEPREPGQRATGRVATSSESPGSLSAHWFSSIDLPLAREISDAALNERGVDQDGVPLGTKARRDLLLRRSVRFELGEPRRVGGGTLEIPLVVENIRGGHRIPAGFSQEREMWVHLKVEDGRGGVVYEVGRVDRDDEDLDDKVFDRVNTNPDIVDGLGRPLGLFGGDVRDGPDVPQWSPRPDLGGSEFRGKGLVNFQNGFLRCVTCLGPADADGTCGPLTPGGPRAERLTDGSYDIDTGECISNLDGRNALLEIFFPVGALDASRGIVKGPDAIIDTRSLAPHRPVRYTYVLPTNGRSGPFHVTAKLFFRSFPPYLVRAFAAYEAEQTRRGLRPTGPLVTLDMLRRVERVELAAQELVVP
jgi:eukaryotic-like serine/threonine-protein kinase